MLGSPIKDASSSLRRSKRQREESTISTPNKSESMSKESPVPGSRPILARSCKKAAVKTSQPTPIPTPYPHREESQEEEEQVVKSNRIKRRRPDSTVAQHHSLASSTPSITSNTCSPNTRSLKQDTSNVQPIVSIKKTLSKKTTKQTPRNHTEPTLSTTQSLSPCANVPNDANNRAKTPPNSQASIKTPTQLHTCSPHTVIASTQKSIPPPPPRKGDSVSSIRTCTIPLEPSSNDPDSDQEALATHTLLSQPKPITGNVWRSPAPLDAEENEFWSSPPSNFRAVDRFKAHLGAFGTQSHPVSPLASASISAAEKFGVDMARSQSTSAAFLKRDNVSSNSKQSFLRSTASTSLKVIKPEQSWLYMSPFTKKGATSIRLFPTPRTSGLISGMTSQLNLDPSTSPFHRKESNVYSSRYNSPALSKASDEGMDWDAKPSHKRSSDASVSLSSTSEEEEEEDSVESVMPMDTMDVDSLVAGNIPESVLHLVCQYMLNSVREKRIDFQDYLNVAVVCKDWKKVAVKNIWKSLAFTSLYQLQKIYNLLCPPGHMTALRGESKKNFRKMLFCSKLDLESAAPSEITSLETTPASSLLSTPATTRRQSHVILPHGAGYVVTSDSPMEYAQSVESLSFSYIKPVDNRPPKQYPIHVIFTELFPNLSCIQLKGSPQWIDDALLSKISKTKHLRSNLKQLSLSRCDKISTDALVKYLPKLQGLHTLTLENCSGVTDAVLEVIGSLGELQTLRIPFSNHVTSMGLERMIQSTQANPPFNGGLSCLDVSSCPHIDDGLFAAFRLLDEASALCSISPRLQELNVAQLNRLTAQGFIDYFAGGSSRLSLKVLDISQVECVKVEGVMDEVLMSVGRSLEELYMRDIPGIDLVKTMKQGLAFCSRLRLLDVKGTQKNTPVSWEGSISSKSSSSTPSSASTPSLSPGIRHSPRLRTRRHASIDLKKSMQQLHRLQQQVSVPVKSSSLSGSSDATELLQSFMTRKVAESVQILL